MQRLIRLAIATGAALTCACSSAAIPPTESIDYYQVSNTLDSARAAAKINIPLQSLKLAEPSGDLLVTVEGKAVPSQLSDSGKELLVSLNLPASAHKTLAVHRLNDGTLNLDYPAQTYAEMQARLGGKRNKKGVYSGGQYYPVAHMSLPASHTIGDKFLKYEGFGWESNQIAYRYYFDHRGAIDIFGKIKTGLFLPRVGQDGHSYHSLTDWGMDILKVKTSLGIGGVAAWVDGKVIKPTQVDAMSADIVNGPLESGANLYQHGWPVGGKKHDLTTRYRIRANSPLTHINAQLSGIAQLATGIVRHGVKVLSYAPKNGRWGYLATYGNQSLHKDNLGMVIFFPMSEFESFAKDEVNQLVILNNKAGEVNYYSGAYWSMGPKGPKNLAAFKAKLKKQLARLDHPVSVAHTNHSTGAL